MSIPLPGLKPNAEGGYTFCPKCAIGWALILVALLTLAYVALRKKRDNELKRG